MILLKPFIILLALFMLYFPYVRFIGIGILMFVYHTLIKNRNIHVSKMKKIYDSKGLKIPVKEKVSYIPFFLYIIFTVACAYIMFDITAQIDPTATSKEIEAFILAYPKWKSQLMFFSFIGLWISFVYTINRIIKDLAKMQGSQIENNLLKGVFIRHRDGNLIMILRIVTLNLYSFVLLISLLRETALLFLASGTINDSYKSLIITKEEKKKDKEDIVSLVYNKIVNEIKGLSGDDIYSKVFYEVTKLQKQTAKDILKKLLDNNVIDNDDFSKINDFI